MSDHLPMLGTLTPNRWGGAKPTNRKHVRHEVKAARRNEERLFAKDIADELEELRFEAALEAEILAADFDPNPLTFHAGDGFGFYATNDHTFDLREAA